MCSPDGNYMTNALNCTLNTPTTATTSKATITTTKATTPTATTATTAATTAATTKVTTETTATTTATTHITTPAPTPHAPRVCNATACPLHSVTTGLTPNCSANGFCQDGWCRLGSTSGTNCVYDAVQCYDKKRWPSNGKPCVCPQCMCSLTTDGANAMNCTAPMTTIAPTSLPTPKPTPAPQCSASNTTACDDHDVCTKDSCMNGICCNDLITGCCKQNQDCDDGNSCTNDACNAATGVCSHTPLDCSDSNSCTTDSCDAKTGKYNNF